MFYQLSGALHPFPYLSVDCCENLAITFPQYSDLLFCRIFCLIVFPMFRYKLTDSVFTVTATSCLLRSINDETEWNNISVDASLFFNSFFLIKSFNYQPGNQLKIIYLVNSF